MHLTLRHKVNGAIIITFFLIAAVFTAIQVPFQQRRLQTATRNIELLLRTLVERDQEQLANEIFDSRFNAIKLRLEQMRNVEGIIAIGVFDASGKLLMADGAPFPEREIAAEEIENIRRHSHIHKRPMQGQAGLLLCQEIRFLGEHLGFIRIYYSLARVAHEQRIFLLIFGSLLGAILLVMLMVLNLILSKVVLNPILHLRDATRSITRGNLSEDIHIRSEDELGNLARSFTVMRDAIKTHIADLERLTTIMESTSDLVSIARPDEQFIYMNRAGRKMLGWGDHDSLAGKSIPDVHPMWAVEKVKHAGIPTAIAYGVWAGETALIGADGSVFPVSQVIMSHQSADGETEYLSTIIRDISESKRIEETLRKYEVIVSSTSDLMSFVDRNYTYRAVNKSYLKAHQKTASELIGRSVIDLHGTEVFHERIKSKLDRCLAGAEVKWQEWFDYPGLGRCFMEIIYTPYFDATGQVSGIVVNARDITARKRAEEEVARHREHLEELVEDRTLQLEQEIDERRKAERQIAASLAEKEVLLREIHHRVKNNLNTVSNLLYLQSRTIADGRITAAFRESRNRIQTMARVHELLYRSESLERISMNAYLKELAADLGESFPDCPVAIETNASGVMMEIDRAIPCGLIVTELVSNSLKYAFAEGSSGGRIRVGLSAKGDEYKLEVADNGSGLPEGLDIAQTRSLGLRLVEMLTRQLHGTVAVQSVSGQGTCFGVSFAVAELVEEA